MSTAVVLNWLGIVVTSLLVLGLVGLLYRLATAMSADEPDPSFRRTDS